MVDLSKAVIVQKKKLYTKKMFRLLQSFYKTFQGSSRDIQMIDQYMKVYKPRTSVVGANVLPVKAAKALKPHKHCTNPKVHDVFYAYLSNTIKIFWAFLEDEETLNKEPELLENMIKLREIAERGLGIYVMDGNAETGYTLKKNV